MNLTGPNAPLYSAVDLGAKALKRKVGTGAEFLKELMALPGIKAQEIQDRKLGELMGLPKMTHEQFLSELGKRPIAPLKETVLSDNSEIPPQYDSRKLQLPRGNNYREVLYQLPHFEDQIPLMHLKDRLENNYYIDPYESDDWNEQEREHLLNQIQSYERDRAKHYPEEPYEAPHFEMGADEHPFPNLMAHLRLSDRTGPNGERLLHAEELQSDWHQQGRKEGYKDPQLVDKYLKEYENAANARLAFNDSVEKTYSQLDPEQKKQYDALAKARNESFENYRKEKDKIPDAPYKKNWQELLLKKLLHEGAINGYHGILITPGQAQNERYGLEKHIKELHYSGSNLRAYNHEGEPVIQQTGVDDKELRRLVGDELADKLMAQKPEGTLRSLYGQDIKVGGEGQRAFYDQILPSFLNKFGKKYGVQVGQMPISTGSEMSRGPTGNDMVPTYTPTQTMVHHFPITEEMRQDILGNGLPAYKDGGDIYYHGSNEDIHEFHPSKIGTFLALNPEEAERFAVLKNMKAGKPMNKDVAIYPIHADIKNPFDSTNPEHLERLLEMAKKVIPNDNHSHSVVHGLLDAARKGYGNESNFSFMESPDLQKLIKAMGHDAYYVTESGNKNLAVYDPKKL
ncbi:MAG TPA: hypothetical protein PLQ34_09770, partial [Ferrovaceae bacterium]|nr:hypothetical protein [Ferrovaceae bacterium]